MISYDKLQDWGDTMTYDNILKALGTQNTSESRLTYEEQAQNYSLFSDLMRKGVRLQDLIDKANTPKEPSIDTELFSIMEVTVAKEEGVRSAKAELEQMGQRILRKICMSDPQYSNAYKNYRDQVTKAYMDKKEGSSSPPAVPMKEEKK